MTCIVGISTNAGVIIGADSLGSNSHTGQIRTDSKVFERDSAIGELGKEKFIFGASGSYPFIQTVKFRFTPPANNKKNPNSDYEYMCTDFIDALKKLLDDCPTFDGKEEKWSVLVGYRGMLYTIYYDYQVGMNKDNFSATGSGEDLALGSLFTSGYTLNLTPVERIELAIKAASQYVLSVGGPVETIEIKNKKSGEKNENDQYH